MNKKTSFRWRRFQSPLSVLIKLLLLLLFVLFQRFFPDIAGETGVGQRYVDAILFFLTAHLLIESILFTFRGFYRKRHKLAREETDNFILGINQIAAILSFLFFVATLLILFEINIREALTAISIIATALVILFKDYVGNMINGMILMFSNQISLNDQVKIGEHKGRIIDLNLLNVHLLNDDDDLILIPNSSVLGHEVINYTKRPVRKVSIEFEVGYQTFDKIEQLESYLITCIQPFADNIQPDSYNLKTVEVRKDSALMKFQYLLRDESEKEIERKIRRTTVRSVLNFVNRTRE